MLDLNLILWWSGIGLACLLLIWSLFFGGRRQKENPVTCKPETVIPEEASEALEPVYFPGEDVVASQLDLARAYIDMGKVVWARKILDKVMLEGNPSQQALAKQLLSELK
jgi:FimV-like protein